MTRGIFEKWNIGQYRRKWELSWFHTRAIFNFTLIIFKGKGRVVQFSAIRGGGSSCFITEIGTHLTQSTTEATPSSSKGKFSNRGWKSTHGWCTVEMAISCSAKSVGKLRSLTEWARKPRAEILEILHSFDMLVFKNIKLPTSVYMLFLPKGMGHMFIDLELTLLGLGLIVCWRFESQDSQQRFSSWISVPRVARLEDKCERFTVKFLF